MLAELITSKSPLQDEDEQCKEERKDREDGDSLTTGNEEKVEQNEEKLEKEDNEQLEEN